MKHILVLILALLMAIPAFAEETEQDWSIWDVIDMDTQEITEAESIAEAVVEAEVADPTAREDFINRII